MKIKKSGKNSKEDNAEIKTTNIKWCDINCPYAEWPKTADVDGSGICRTFIALYCKKKTQTACDEKFALFGGIRPPSSEVEVVAESTSAV